MASDRRSDITEQLIEAARRLGWEKPIVPSADVIEAVTRRYGEPRTDEEAAQLWRKAQAEEMMRRYWVDARVEELDSVRVPQALAARSARLAALAAVLASGGASRGVSGRRRAGNVVV